METEKLKKAVKKIKMTDEIRERVINGAVEAVEAPAKKTIYVRPALIAAAVVLCLCFTGAFAAGRRGFFRDVKNRWGSVVGTAYENAADEITVTAVVSDGKLTVAAVFVEPDKVPYSEFDSFGINSFRIVDAAGSAVMEGGPTSMTEVSGGGAEISVPIDGLPGGGYKLVIDALVGGSKADQPMTLSGGWECEFTV